MERSLHAPVLSCSLIGLRPFRYAAFLVRGRFDRTPKQQRAQHTDTNALFFIKQTSQNVCNQYRILRLVYWQKHHDAVNTLESPILRTVARGGRCPSGLEKPSKSAQCAGFRSRCYTHLCNKNALDCRFQTIKKLKKIFWRGLSPTQSLSPLENGTTPTTAPQRKT